MSSELKKKSKNTTVILEGLVPRGWLKDCVNVSLNLLSDNNIPTESSRAQVIKANVFDILRSVYEK